MFETEQASFQTKKIWLYGKKQLVRYYSADLLWGQGLYRKLRFVLAEYDGKRVIFISTNLSLHPSSIIRFYGYRFRIEGAFRTFKLDSGGMAYHFWTKAAPRLNHFRKKDAPDALSAVTSARERKRILKTVRATGMYALLCSISMGGVFPIQRIFQKQKTQNPQLSGFENSIYGRFQLAFRINLQN